jgi:F0F1-type ATP synthase assembly protein I
MSNQEKRGVSLWFLLVAVFVGLLSGFLVNNAKLVDKAKVDQRTTASQPSDFSR